MGLGLIGDASSSVCSLVFPTARTPIRACHRGDSSNLINAITVEEELEAAQSKPTLAKAFGAG